MRMEVAPNICVLQDVSFSPAEMQDVATVVGRDLFTAELRETLGQFEQAKNFGSLIVPKLRDPAEVARLVRLKDFGGDLLLREVQNRVLRVLEMAEALSPKYHVVVANPPYAAHKGLNVDVQNFAKSYYPNSKYDLFAMFLERSLSLTLPKAFMASINMQSWMFLSSYANLRSKLLNSSTISTMAHLGERAFDSIGGAVVSTTAFVMLNSANFQTKGAYVRLTDGRNEAEKSGMLRAVCAGNLNSNLFWKTSAEFEGVPGVPVAYWIKDNFLRLFVKERRLGDLIDARQGMATAENERFLRLWWEPSKPLIAVDASSSESFVRTSARWASYNKGGPFRKWYGNHEFVVDWEQDGSALRSNQPKSVVRNPDFYFRESVSWSDISTDTNAFRYYPEGFIFDSTGHSAFPTNEYDKFQLLCMANTKITSSLVKIINPTIHLHVGYLKDLPALSVEKSLHQSTALRCIELARQDWNFYETSWNFHTLRLLSSECRAETLEATYGPLRAHWQSMTDEMQRLEEENNRIFIDAYGLQDELTPEVPIEEITLTCNPAYRYGVKGTEEDRETRLRADTMAEFLHYAVGCMLGRYSLDEPGLILANQGEALTDYLVRVPDPSFMPDKDNVIPVLDGDWFADDITERFRQFLRVTFCESHFRENLKFIEDSLGKDIRRYFTKDFYADHVKRYKKRPIYWMFSSPKGTFNALIYMHRYKPDTVSIMLNEYLREFISKLEAERGRLEKLSDDPGASQAQSTKAVKDVAVVAKQIDELTEWERDVVFPLAQAKIEIDLDDGVKANYPKFGVALKKIPGLEDGEA